MYLQAKLNPEIEEMLAQDPIDLGPWVRPGDARKLRKIMEEHCRIKDVEIPFDMLFDNLDYTPDSEEDEEKAAPPPPRPKSESNKPRQRSVRETKPEPEPEPAPAEEE